MGSSPCAWLAIDGSKHHTQTMSGPPRGSPVCCWMAPVVSNHPRCRSAPRYWLHTPIRLRQTASHAVRAPLSHLSLGPPDQAPARKLAEMGPSTCARLPIGGSRPLALIWLGPPVGGPVYVWLARVVSNHRPLPCQGSALPLSYAPMGKDILPDRWDLSRWDHSTVTDLARLRGWSTSQPRMMAMW